jgi:hypothetical protein
VSLVSLVPFVSFVSFVISWLSSANAVRFRLESHIVGVRDRSPRTEGHVRSRGRRRLSQTRALRVLKEVAEALNSASTEQRATGEALRRMADLLGVETGWVWLRDPASDRFLRCFLPDPGFARVTCGRDPSPRDRSTDVTRTGLPR